MAPQSGRLGAGRLLRMQQCVRELLAGIGEDCDREGLVDTPKVSSVVSLLFVHLGPL